jgi:hypothetical protein
MGSSARKWRRPSSRGSSRPLEHGVDELRTRFATFGERALGWDDALALATALGATVELRPCPEDAILLVPAGAPRVIVSERLDLSTWGVFCVAHELGHWLLHPGTREYYLRSPGWLDKTESQANVVGLLALWPRPAPYPRVLRIEEGDGVVHLHVAFTTSRQAGPAPRWRSRTLTMPRYAPEGA